MAGTDPPSSQQRQTVSGGVNLDAREVNVGGDVVGRDKLESAGGHIIHAGDGTTVIIGERPAPTAGRPTPVATPTQVP